MAAKGSWVRKVAGSVSHTLKRKGTRRKPFARTERRMDDIISRHGRDYIGKMAAINIGELPAFSNSGRSKLSDRDLRIIGSVMDTHLGVSGFYVQSSALIFLISAPEIGAILLRQAIVDELDVKLMPPAKLDTELPLEDLKAKFGDDVVKYVHKIDLSKLLFPDSGANVKVPSVICDLARITLDRHMSGLGHFSKIGTDTYGVLFETPSPEFAKQHMAQIMSDVQGACINLIAIYKEHSAAAPNVLKAGIAKKAEKESAAKQMQSGGKAKALPTEAMSEGEKKWFAAFSGSIAEAASYRTNYRERLKYLPWDQGISYDPILRSRTASIVGRFCRPSKPTALESGGSDLRLPPKNWAALPDLPLVQDLIDNIRTDQSASKPEIVCLPIHYHTIANNLLRETMFIHLAKLSKSQCHYISAELVGFDKDVSPEMINEYIRMLKPFFRTILIQADIGGKLLEHFAGLPVHAVGLDLDFPGISDEMKLRNIRKFAERSHSFFRRAYVRGAASDAQIQVALDQDYNYISGPVLREDEALMRQNPVPNRDIDPDRLPTFREP